MLVALLGLVACSDNAEDVSESSEANVSMKNISVTAQVPGANTYGALKAFSLSDVLHVTFQKSDGTQTGRTQTLRCAESTGSTATFSAWLCPTTPPTCCSPGTTPPAKSIGTASP